MSKIAQAKKIIDAAVAEFRALPLQKNGRPNRAASSSVNKRAYAALDAIGYPESMQRSLICTAFEVAIGKPSFDRGIGFEVPTRELACI